MPTPTLHRPPAELGGRVEIDGARLRYHRLRRGLTQRQLADLAGMPAGGHATICRIERARAGSHWSTAAALAGALVIPFAELVRP
jgi:transcriptional regulator with XRE-family HTH domain